MAEPCDGLPCDLSQIGFETLIRKLVYVDPDTGCLALRAKVEGGGSGGGTSNWRRMEVTGDVNGSNQSFTIDEAVTDILVLSDSLAYGDPSSGDFTYDNAVAIEMAEAPIRSLVVFGNVI